MELQLRVGSSFRDQRQTTDDELGQYLVGRVKEALERGSAPPSALLVRPERLDCLGLAPVVQAGMNVGRFVSTLTRSRTVEPTGEVLAVGVLGTVQTRPPGGGEQVPMVVVFLEWPDCRWWQWKALLGPSGELLGATQTLNRAVDGDAMPHGLGRWWSTGRKLPGEVRFDRWPGRPAPTADHVH